MLTVALVGLDGAGKTSIAKRLLEAPPMPIKYLYMGSSIESSNIALPTSRLAHRLKMMRHKRSLKRAGEHVPETITFHGAEHRVDRRGPIGATARLLNRVAEFTYRQSVAWIYLMRGYAVLYDRHFLFDLCPPPSSASSRRRTDRIQGWLLERVFPKPSLVIFLDAPVEVLYARKQEISEDELRSERDALLERSRDVENFIRVDATRPVEQVLAEVIDIISKHVQAVSADKLEMEGSHNSRA